MKGLLKHKGWLIAGGVVLGLILVIVILIFTLFAVRKVEIDFKNQSTIFSGEAQENIANNSAIPIGASIFTLNKTYIKDQLEKDNPYLKVVNIESVFPNKIIIHCAEREETYAVKAGESKYFICDADFKVLNIQAHYRDDQYNAILFEGLESNITNANRVNAGGFLEFNYDAELLKSLGQALLKNNKTVAQQRGLISSITLSSKIYPFTATNLPYFEIKDFNGFVTNIYKPDTLLAEKLQYMFATLSQVIYKPNVFYASDLEEGKITLDEIKEDYYLDYTLEIMENNNSELVIRLEKLNTTV